MREFDGIKQYMIFAGLLVWCGPALALPKLDKDTCDQLRTEKITFVQSGILADFEKGAEWGKGNLSVDRLREVEHFILLDEQLKFGCREAVLTLDAKAAGEAAQKLELNPDADPTAPETTPEAAAAPPAAATAAGVDPSRSLADDATAVTKPVKRPKPAAAKPKPKDAYTPPPGTGTVLETPAGAIEAAPKAQ